MLLSIFCLGFVFPTYVGMFRRATAPRNPRSGFPHVCGDVPVDGGVELRHGAFSPRMWGCSGDRGEKVCAAPVFPTYVGMFRASGGSASRAPGFPHVCGDVPCFSNGQVSGAEFSPRMWGCSGGEHVAPVRGVVFPTYVGMFRPCTWPRPRPRSFPHVCGDVPYLDESGSGTRTFSPRMWGCSAPAVGRGLGAEVFPTYVGMFRASCWACPPRRCFPHVCGDVP